MEESFEVSKRYENNLDIKKRKNQGIYYTPYVVVEYILEQTIQKHDVVDEPYPKVLDMCCGCGNFLISAYEILHKKFLTYVWRVADNIVKLFYRKDFA